jgi:hypothetical protein
MSSNAIRGRLSRFSSRGHRGEIGSLNHLTSTIKQDHSIAIRI